MFLLYSLIASFLWALINHLDKYLIDKVVKNREIGALLVFSGIIGVPVSSFIYIFKPDVLGVSLFPAFITVIAGILYLVAVYFYLRALSIDEASFVVPFGFFVPLFGSMFGYIFLNEIFSIRQVLGMILVIAGSVYLNIFGKKIRDLALNMQVTKLMLIAGFFASLNGFIFKLGNVDGLDFWQSIFWEHVGFSIFSIGLMILIPLYRKQFITLIKINGPLVIGLNIISELITFLGNFAFHYSTLITNLALTQLLAEGFQPFFVLVISVLLTIFLPKISKEDINKRIVSLRLVGLLIMLVGVYFIEL